MKTIITLLAIVFGGCALGGCALLAAGVVGGVIVADQEPEVYIAPPIIIGPVWRPQPFFRPPFHHHTRRNVTWK
jgi:hypothetical protein